jgi:hypothetical protein
VLPTTPEKSLLQDSHLPKVVQSTRSGQCSSVQFSVAGRCNSHISNFSSSKEHPLLTWCEERTTALLEDFVQNVNH